MGQDRSAPLVFVSGGARVLHSGWFLPEARVAGGDPAVIIRLLLLAAMISLAACTALSGQKRPDLQGVWAGISINACNAGQPPGRCRAVQRISFTMMGADGEASGFYRCAGGAMCRNLATSGVIKGLQFRGRRLWFRVMRDDHSSCLFSAIPSATRMAGGFYCFHGSAAIERGAWRVERVY